MKIISVQGLFYGNFANPVNQKSGMSSMKRQLHLSLPCHSSITSLSLPCHSSNNKIDNLAAHG